MNAALKPVTGPFEKTPGWLDWYEGPSKPSFTLPRGSVDAHCHVFGPGAEFPYAAERKYTPCDASKAQLFALRDRLGFDRNVIVQATCHGADNSAMVDALLASDGRARGIATVRRDVTDAELKRLHEAGVRGVRFNFVKRLVDFTPQDELKEIAERIIEHDWHIVVYFEAADLPELTDFLSGLPTIIVVDHMGRPDVTKPVDSPEFTRFLKFMEDYENVWCKVTGAERLSVSGPPALNGETERLSRRRPIRAQGGRGISGPGAVGHRLAASESQGSYARRRAHGRHHSPYRNRARPAGAALGRQSDAALLA